MSDRETLIGKLDIGNIFHAEYPNGASCICLVLSVNDTSIQARRVTTQENLEFDRQTGIETDSSAQSLAVIDSVAPLPDDIRDVFLAMDRKFRAHLAMDEKSRFALAPEDRKLTESEKRAFRFINTFYPSNPLPPPGPF